MFIVGLTGGIATGKSTVLAMFRELGVPVVDADEVARKVIEPGTQGWYQIVDCFGEGILTENGNIDRAKLADIIFENIEKRMQLNFITHRKIRNVMISKAFMYLLAGKKYVVMELPLLFETQAMMQYIHKIITVVCDNEQQVTRLCNRNNLSMDKARKRIDAQMPLDIKIAQSHFVIDNCGDISNTRQQVECIIKILNASWFPWFIRTALLGVVLIIFFGTSYLIHVLKELCM